MSSPGAEPRELVVDTPRGEGRLVTYAAEAPEAVLLLSHGAGGGIEAPDLEVLARVLPEQGVSVVLFEQPWRRAGRRMATPPPTLDEAFVAAGGVVRAEHPGVPLVVGGRSAGARSAARTARLLDASGCLALAFPLHPPGKPERTRVDELHAADVTTLVVQGDRDTFGKPDEFPDDVDLCVVPGADHSFKVLKSGPLSQEEALAVLSEATLEWVLREAAGERAANEHW